MAGYVSAPTLKVLNINDMQPNVMYQTDHPAYKTLGSIGKEITTKVKPDAVVVFSAHWQGGDETIYVNTAEMTDLIYEYDLSFLIIVDTRIH